MQNFGMTCFRVEDSDSKVLCELLMLNPMMMNYPSYSKRLRSNYQGQVLHVFDSILIML